MECSNEVQINFKNVCKSFINDKRSESKTVVLEKLNLCIKRNEFVCFFGPNGCGKTTILNLISGLEQPDKGKIEIKNIKNTPRISYIFQNFNDTLLPWRNNLDNISFILEADGFSKKKARKRVKEYFVNNSINFPLNKYPYQLSGGEKQLLAIYRALISKPDIFLLDEPFNSLDYYRRTKVENTFLEFWEREKVTTLCVSHEIDEAILLSDRVLVLGSLPLKEVSEVKIDLKRPRNSSMIQSNKFEMFKKRVLSLLIN